MCWKLWKDILHGPCHGPFWQAYHRRILPCFVWSIHGTSYSPAFDTWPSHFSIRRAWLCNSIDLYPSWKLFSPGQTHAWIFGYNTRMRPWSSIARARKSSLWANLSVVADNYLSGKLCWSLWNQRTFSTPHLISWPTQHLTTLLCTKLLLWSLPRIVSWLLLQLPCFLLPISPLSLLHRFEMRILL